MTHNFDQTEVWMKYLPEQFCKRTFFCPVLLVVENNGEWQPPLSCRLSITLVHCVNFSHIVFHLFNIVKHNLIIFNCRIISLKLYFTCRLASSLRRIHFSILVHFRKCTVFRISRICSLMVIPEGVFLWMKWSLGDTPFSTRVLENVLVLPPRYIQHLRDYVIFTLRSSYDDGSSYASIYMYYYSIILT